MPAVTIVNSLLKSADAEPGRLAYAFLERGEAETGRLTREELARRVLALGASLQKAGLERKPVLLLFRAGLDFVASFLGCLAAGAVAVPVNCPLQGKHVSRLRAIASDVGPGAVLTTADLAPRLREWTGSSPDLAEASWIPVDEMDLAGPADWRRPNLDGSHVAFLQYTSGSTSAPKGVMVRHSNLLHNCECLRRIADDDEQSVHVSWLPHFHDMGLIDGILHPLFSGHPAYLMSPLAFLQKPVRWLRAISRYRGTNSGGPNFAYDLCVQKVAPEEREGLDLSSWRMAYNGAEPVRAETLERFSRAFAGCGFRWEAFYPVYGLAEATLVVSSGERADAPALRRFDVESLERHRVAPGNGGGARVVVGCGRLVDATRAEIVEPDTSERCEPGRIGEVWLAGPSVAGGYWRRPEETGEVFGAFLASGEGPFLRTGDLGFFDHDELFVVGRLKDLIIVAGRNHHPQDLELSAERSHPAIRCCSAFSVDAGGEERLVIAAEVRVKGSGSANGAEGEGLDEVARAIRRAVAEEHDLQVHRVELLPAGGIPKTSSGKIQRQACRARFLAQARPTITEETW